MNGSRDVWRTRALGDVVDVLDGRRIPVNAKEREKRKGQVPYYGATGQVGWIDDFIFDEELILLGEDGAPFLEPDRQKAYVIRGKSWINNHAHVLRARPGITNIFLLHQLNALDYRPYVSGTTRLKLTQAAMRRMLLQVPPLPVQEAVVAEIEKHLTRLDAAVAALRRVQSQLKRYRAAVRQAAYDGLLVRSEAPSRESMDAAMRPDWETVTVDSVTDLVQYGTSAKTNSDPTGVPVIRMGNIQDGRLVLEELKYLPARHPEFPELLLKPGDVLFNRTNSAELVGKTAVYSGVPEPCSFASYLIRLRTTPRCDPSYLSGYVNSPACRRWVAGVVSQQVGQANVNGSKLRALEFPLPPLAEQHRIVAEVERRFSVVEELEATVAANLKRAARLRHSILDRAFRGELVPDAAGS